MARTRGRASPRRRGRPTINWTWSRKRRLLRLYLCTPEAELPLKRILELLARGPFQPKPRHTQCLLNDLLAKSYRQKRPKSRVAMAERLAFLRSIRDGRRETGAHAVFRGETAEECAILLHAHPGGRKPKPPARDGKGEREDDSIPSSPCSPRQERRSTGIYPSTGPAENLFASGSSLGNEPTDTETPPPAIFKNPWTPCEEIRHEKQEFLRERCPSKSSSFLADVASLLSGLSIRSSLSRSSSASPRLSMRSSVSSRKEALGSGAQGELKEHRRSTTLPIPESFAWPVDVQASAASEHLAFPSYAWPGSATGKEAYDPGSSPHKMENQELVRSCCGQTSWCIHQRITAVMMYGNPADAFACTEAEANGRDGFGNTALHVAARWGAPWPVLSSIMALASHLDATNHRGETFLHVLDPFSLEQKDLADMAEHLVRRGFDFAQLDCTGQSCVSRLLSRPSFSLESLENLFCRLPEPARLVLLRLGQGELISAIHARLLADPEHTSESAAEYCTYFAARYNVTSTSL
ncbi:hypothetical protein C7999DRAFT_43170 [Corynascus novoguineensis]|uniref:Ankyrin repeat-containing protein n=1 Tax=Corynascus novoguineensis TaxID=1126955 RepID=A0AAN7HH57_9PEZI|nr:hypothetical protein C7999DRAFT_43170 [Corynascus novoguineensis]